MVAKLIREPYPWLRYSLEATNDNGVCHNLHA
jgi:hypothetical protein